MKNKNNFDLLRLIAATDVMLSHAIEHLNLPVSPWIMQIIAGFPGVPVFFVISGFLITGTFLRNDGALPSYFRNRTLRIYPAMWLNLVLITLMMLAFGVVNIETIFGPSFWVWMGPLLATGSSTVADALARHVPLLWNGHLDFSWNDRMPFWPGGSLWTIMVELCFYALVPIVFVAPLRRSRWLALSSLGMWASVSYAVCLHLRTHPSSLISASSPAAYFWVFAIGSACNLMWPRISFLFEGKAVAWLALYVGLCLVLPGWPNYQQPGFIATPLVIALSGLTLSFAFSFRSWSSALLRGNDISYGIYLHHMPIVMLLMGSGWMGSLYAIPLLLCGTLIAAIASWKLIELPALRRKDKASTSLAEIESSATVTPHAQAARSIR